MTPESYHHQQVLLMLSSSHILPSDQLVQYLPQFKNVSWLILMPPKENKGPCSKSKEMEPLMESAATVEYMDLRSSTPGLINLLTSPL
jgi:hypothetical protein